jgi:hypothetical protein
MGVQAQFGGMNQIISSPVTGPIKSNGGAITVTSTGSIAGDPNGVEALTYLSTDEPNERSPIAPMFSAPTPSPLVMAPAK